MEKLALVVVVSARKVRPYFQSHSIIVMAPMPLHAILHSPSQSGRLPKWAVELSEYDIEYRNKTCAKSQVLAGFIIELPPETPPDTHESSPDAFWILHVNGSSSKQGSGVGIRLASPAGKILEQSFRLNFDATNNVAGYEALIAGLKLARGLKVNKLRAFCHSQLVAKQFNGEYTARDERMEAYLALTQDVAKQNSMGENTSADALAALALTSDPNQRRIIPVEFIEKPSIEDSNEDHVFIARETEDFEEIDAEPNDQQTEDGTETEYGCNIKWIGAIRSYIADGEVSAEKWAAWRL
uniref:Gag-pol-polyprotein1 n=1 Tax=Arabidopsis cebennensis TaxID=97979 RepID=B2BXZ3_9BRAS|nr:gag-pol-polyprotein1 [Arabidopsis cebennensis]